MVPRGVILKAFFISATSDESLNDVICSIRITPNLRFSVCIICSTKPIDL